MYNWGGSRPGYDDDSESVCRMNYINNYAKLGPNSSKGHIYQASCRYFKTYFSGNWYDGAIPDDPWKLVRFPEKWSKDILDAYKQSKPFESAKIHTDTAEEAYEKVLAFAGAIYPVRDAADARVVASVRNGTGKIIGSQDKVGGWPVLETANPPADADRDGMPDDWENARKLNPNDAADGPKDRDGDGYTNLEDYLNDLVRDAIAIPTP